MERARLRTCLAVMAMLLTTAAALFADPPATQSADHLRSDVKQWLGELSADDAQIRGDAAVKLMGLTPEELPVLAEVLKTHPPDVQQQASLPAIVEQIYMTGLSYEQASGGFLGVSFDPDQQYMETGGEGVEIRHRLPGFCAYRYLEDGDVVLAMSSGGRGYVTNDESGRRVLVRSQGAMVPLHSSEDLRVIVAACAARDELAMDVLRRGRVVHLSFHLDARPILSVEEGQTVEHFEAERQDAAEKYWQNNFAPLMNPEKTGAARHDSQMVRR